MVEGISVFDLIENVRKKDDKGVEKDSEKTLIDRRVEELKNSSYHVCSFEKDSDDWSDAREMATVITKIIDEDGEKERDRILKAFDNMTEGVSNAIDRHPSHYTLEEEIPEDVCDRLIHTMVAIYEGLGVPVYDLILDENEYQYDSSDRVFRNNFDNLNNPELIIDDFYRKVKRDEVSSIEEDFFSNSHETIQDYPTLTRYKNKKTGETAYVLGNGIPDDCEKIDLFSNEEISLITKEVKNHLQNEQLWAEQESVSEYSLRFGDNPDYYLYHQVFLNAVIEHPNFLKYCDKSAEILSKTMTFESQGCLESYVKAFEKLGSSQSLPYLLGNLKSDDILTQRMSAEILYRLELGRIGVTEEGVKYLDKIYNLGKYNDPDFFVRRLNNSGLIVILAKKGNIEGVFPLDLNSKEDVIHAEVRQLISQELFLPKADETPIQRQEREEYLKLFLENYENIFNDNFFQNTGVRLNSLDLHEQGWFLLHYTELSTEGDKDAIERLKNFVKEYGEYGLKSFLALEYGGSGEDIIAFSENDSISKEQKLNLFKNFYHIANEAMDWRKIFEKVEGGLDYKFSIEAYESLLRKNAEFFKAAQIISKSSDNEKLMLELFSNMNSVSRSLISLECLYNGGSSLRLAGKPSVHDEYGEDGELIKGARHSWVFDSITGDRIAVSVRSKNTIEKNGIKGGGPRINFKVTNPKTKVSTRIGFDLSYYNVLMGESDTPSVSLDLGVLDPRFEAVNYATESVGRVLSLVQDSEGGHNESSFNPRASEHFEDIANSFVEYINKTF